MPCLGLQDRLQENWARLSEPGAQNVLAALVAVTAAATSYYDDYNGYDNTRRGSYDDYYKSNRNGYYDDDDKDYDNNKGHNGGYYDSNKGYDNKYDDDKHAKDDRYHYNDDKRHQDSYYGSDDKDQSDHYYDDKYHRDDKDYHDDKRYDDQYHRDKDYDDQYHSDKRRDDRYHHDSKYKDDGYDDNKYHDKYDNGKYDDDKHHGKYDDKYDDDYYHDKYDGGYDNGGYQDDDKYDDGPNSFACKCSHAYGVLGYSGDETDTCHLIHHLPTQTPFSLTHRSYDYKTLFPILDPSSGPAMRFQDNAGQVKCYFSTDRRPREKRCYCSPAYESACTHPHGWLSYYDGGYGEAEMHAYLSCEVPGYYLPEVCDMTGADGLHLQHGDRSSTKIEWSSGSFRVTCQHGWWDVTARNLAIDRYGNIWSQLRTSYGSSGVLEARLGYNCKEKNMCGHDDF